MSKELQEKRTYNSKTFDEGGLSINGRKKFTLKAHTGHIHYKDLITKKLKGIDNTLVKKGDHWLMDKASYHLRVPIFSDEFIKFDNQFKGANHSVELKPIGLSKEFIKTDKCH